MLVAVPWKVTAVLVFGSMTLVATEVSIQMKDLPAGVQATVQKQIRSAKLLLLTKEIEKGRTYYEAETTVNGRSRDIMIDSAGAIFEVEQSVPLESVPAAARNALLKRAGAGKVLKVESVTNNSTMHYEAVILKNGKRSEVEVSADGIFK